MPGWAVSSTAHGYFVRGHSPNPRDPGRYGGSWQAAKRLGSAQSGVIVTMPRSRTHAAASSMSARARSGVSRQARERSASSASRSGF